LPLSSGNAGRILIVTSTFSFGLIISTQGTDYIYGHGASFNANQSATLAADGNGGWFIVSTN
jgi:hypothetical protein